MKIFSAQQIREWDKYTITHEPIASIDLMERAATVCQQKILSLFPEHSYTILCGPGNNGGDGLAIARLMRDAGKEVRVYHPGDNPLSDDNRINLERWEQGGGKYYRLEDFDPGAIQRDTVVIDALFGTGQRRPLDGVYKTIVELVNALPVKIISIDLPSGMYADMSSKGNPIIRASYTLSFQLMKLCFLVPENEDFTGELIILDIGLSKRYYELTESDYVLTTSDEIKGIIKPRKKFSHKGSHGTAILFAGKKGMMGAAILAASACLRSGVGKLVCRIPGSGLEIMQVALPEAICSPDEDQDLLEQLPDISPYQSIGIGPGIGKDSRTAALVHDLMKKAKTPLVMDADALNIIAEQGWQKDLSGGMVLTPHIGEFSRLFGSYADDFLRIKACMELSTEKEICIILKGHYTFLSTPRGKGYFNSTGNPGMAKAGSGDALTGMLTAFLAQKYSIDEACRLSVYLHGLAGDIAKMTYGEASFLASDMINLIGKAIDEIV